MALILKVYYIDDRGGECGFGMAQPNFVSQISHSCIFLIFFRHSAEIRTTHQTLKPRPRPKQCTLWPRPRDPETTPSPDWNCQWGPSGAHIAYTRAMSEHRCFPKKRLSSHTMHFKWHHRNLSKMTMSNWKENEWWIIISCYTSILTAAVVR